MYLNNIYTSVTGLMRIGLSITGLLHLTLYVSMFCPASGIIPFRIFRAADETLISEFTQIVLDERTHHVYVAGDNKLYKLTSELTHIDDVTTGPALDFPLCSPLDVEHGRCRNATMMDNIATTLDIHPDERYLLYCGTLKQGVCSIQYLDDIRDIDLQELDITSKMNYVGSRKSSTAFFGNMVTETGDQIHALYAAVSQDQRPLTQSPPAISARRLAVNPRDPTPTLEYVYEDRRMGRSSSIDFDRDLKNSFVVTYVHSFEHKGFTYFLTVQHESVTQNEYKTTLARVCQGDIDFKSYTEQIIGCKTTDNVFYHRATAATVSTLGADMAGRSDLLDMDMLFVTFGQTEGSGDTASADQGSIVCMYPMATIRQLFFRAQKNCYSGRGRILRWINDAQQCKQNLNLLPMTELFCGSSENVGIGARYHETSTAIMKTDRYLATSIQVVDYENKTIAFVGTSNGKLLKVVLDNQSPPQHSVIDLHTEGAVAQDMPLDHDGEHLYVMAGKQITKIPTRSCAVYNECSSCVMTDDPLGCGWCEDHCSTEQECQDPGWRSDSCPPVIHSVRPLSGPLEGGTILTLMGYNFGSPNLGSPNITVQVEIGPQVCEIMNRNMTIIKCSTLPSAEASQELVTVTVKDHTLSGVAYNIGGSSTGGNNYQYQSVNVFDFEPKIGPKSGGILLTVSGENLDIGTNTAVSVVNQDCTVWKNMSTSSRIFCELSPWNIHRRATTFRRSRSRDHPFQGGVKVTIDGAILSPSDLTFLYEDDPNITAIQHNKAIVNGGNLIAVTGDNLYVIQQTYIEVSYNMNETTHEVRALCHTPAIGIPTMLCPAPDISLIASMIDDQPIVTNLRFTTNAFQPYPIESHFIDTLLYYPNPVFYQISTDHRSLPTTDELILKGKAVNTVLTVEDITVYIGNHTCNVTAVYDSYLICKPMWMNNLTYDDLPLIVQVVAGNLVTQVGEVVLVADADSPYSSMLMTHVIAPVLGTLLLLICAAVIGGMRCARCGPFKKKKNAARYMYSEVNRSQPDMMMSHDNRYWQGDDDVRYRRVHSVPESGCLMDDEARRLIEDAKLYIHRDALVLLEVVGQGHFGCVYRGFLKREGDKNEQEVAVKTLKALSEQTYISTAEGQTFIDEALRMREFDHPNILRLIGVSIDRLNKDMPLVVLPFMKHGDLLTYIRDERNTPTVKDLMDFGIQIGDGMAYLSSLKFVHRDLAARNCMVGDDMVIKVADFGLSRDIYERDYYSSEDRKAKLPVKWMALESLEKGIYSSKTDVWSYGVVLWELMTRGVCPYPEVDAWDMIKYIKSGRRMLQPCYCPDALYGIMKQCWSPDDRYRPMFKEVVANMQTIITQMEHRYNEYVSTNITYINVMPETSEEKLSEATGYTQVQHPVCNNKQTSFPVTGSTVVSPHPASDISEDESGYLYPSTCSTYTYQDGTKSTLV